jgi:beta-glucosidase-like glycosyl hydrolase
VNPLAALVLPAIRWHADRGFEPALASVEAALALGVGGFIVFGGERGEVARLTREVAAAARHPLLIASDLERGAGQQIVGLTSLPPPLALGTTDPGAVVVVATITAREARDVGINWALAPVLDLDVERGNPIVQTRAFGAEPEAVAAAGRDWVRACQAGGVLACAKHFPGHGRTTSDSHAGLPEVRAPREILAADLQPYRAAIGVGVAGVMTAHVAYPALDAAGVPATHSAVILGELLRRDLGFDGLVVTDALIMAGAGPREDEARGAVRALSAGCDLLLYPHDAASVAAALERAVAAGELARRHIDGSLRRRAAAAARAAGPAALTEAELAAHRARAGELARHAVALLRGPPPMAPARGVALEVVDDDAGAAYPVPPRDAFAQVLADAGVQLDAAGERVVLLFADVRAWKGRAGLSAETRRRLLAALTRPATTVLFGHPRLADEVPGPGPLLCAWTGDAVMQRAAAERVLAS